MTKIALTLEHLKTYGSITGKEAMELYGYYRLSDGIGVLRKRGHNIRTEMVDGKDRNGDKMSYGRYIYEGED